MACDVDEKCESALGLPARYLAGAFAGQASKPAEVVATPGQPDKPRLVCARDLPRRKLTSREGRAAFVHALAHIEFNAINLALDAVYRFRGLPESFYHDWLVVASEEARHFTALRDRLRDWGYDYGDFAAHDGLWAMACKTAGDVLTRMALGPRLFEARGLDVTPGMIERLNAVGDSVTATVLQMIYDDEIGHVALGSKWFGFLCRQRSLDAEATYLELVRQFFPVQLRGDMNVEARLAAGFSQAELETLAAAGAE